MEKIVIYTDGACSGNPGAGGIGAVLVMGEFRKELSCGFRATTNNRMELTAAIMALAALKRRCAVELCSDSQYLVESMERGWVQLWQAKGWKKKKNRDLWIRLLELCREHEVKFIWVKGHAESEFNNRCDALAVAAAAGGDLLADEGYEAELARQAAQGELF